jgi:superfamily II DNA or RNA helicase
MSFAARYEVYQRDAVAAVVADFTQNPAGRFLLVIPTGGGKTYTAIKAVSAMYDAGLLGPDEKVLWLVHRDELRTQALDSLKRYSEQADRPKLPSLVDVVMRAGVKDYLSNHDKLRMAVVDEAHHVPAASYQRLFERPAVGILGLTATPSRHDGQPLQFDRESYSIGFPDLVDLGVLLRPEIIRVEGGKFDLSDIGIDSDALEVLNNPERNARILAALSQHKDKLRKVIVYVGTKQHARDLYELLKTSSLAKEYESIGLILGQERRRLAAGVEHEEDRKTFIKAMKASERAILVNVDVLTEGYDDPTVNAVVMGRPTNSKLVYMQAIGRAVRLDPENPEKEAFILEVIDDLPNIRYRIDNRWLFSDISDALEPAVEDEAYTSIEELPARIQAVFDRYQVPASERELPPITSRDRVSVLLFKVYDGPASCHHLPIVITNDTRQDAANFFNFLSARMQSLSGLAPEQVMGAVRTSIERFPVLRAPGARKDLLGAMENAWDVVTRSASESVVVGSPWVTFVSFRLRPKQESLSEDLLSFTEDMLNRDAVRDTIRAHEYSDGYVLTRLPLPLRGTWGAILPPTEFDHIRTTVDALRLHTTDSDAVTQWRATVDIVGAATLSIPQRHHQSLVTIVREQLDYFRILQR